VKKKGDVQLALAQNTKNE